MEIRLGPKELELAVKEYAHRRGVSPNLLMDLKIIGGRMGNGSSATIQVKPVLVEVSEPTPQSYGSMGNMMLTAAEEVSTEEKQKDPPTLEEGVTQSSCHYCKHWEGDDQDFPCRLEKHGDCNYQSKEQFIIRDILADQALKALEEVTNPQEPESVPDTLDKAFEDLSDIQEPESIAGLPVDATLDEQSEEIISDNLFEEDEIGPEDPKESESNKPFNDLFSDDDEEN